MHPAEEIGQSDLGPWISGMGIFGFAFPFPLFVALPDEGRPAS